MNERSTRLDRRTMAIYWAAVTLVVIIALSGAATLIYRDYDSRIDAAEQSAMNLANALAEHTTQIFVRLEAVSRAIIEDRADPIVDQDMLSEVMRRRAAAEPAATAIAIIGIDGLVAASSSPAYPVGSDMSETPFFKTLSAADGPASYIDRPYHTAFETAAGLWDGWTMNYGHRIESDAGTFEGLVLIVVVGPFLYGFYSSLEVESGRVIGIVGTDGIIRASNVPEVIGRGLGPNEEPILRAGGGIVIAPSMRTGTERVFAYSSSAVAPMLAYVGVPTAPIYVAWRTASAIILAGLGALFATLIALGIVLGKYVRNRASLMASTLDAARVHQEREFLEAVLNTDGALVAVADPQGKLVVANPAFRAMIGTGGGLDYALGGQLPGIVSKLPYQTNSTVTKADGERRELAWSVTAIREKDGAIKNLVAIGFDITERRAAELAIYQSGKMITLGEMATGIAHEINQPLATIMMALDTLRNRIKTGQAEPAFVDKSLQLLSDQLDRTAAIVSHMRIYGHRSSAAAQPVDPAAAVNGALVISQAQFADAGISLRKTYAAGRHMMLTDPTLIEQIVLNILVNARDAIIDNPASGPNQSDDWIEIGIAAEPDGKMVAITISDSGPGIPPALLERLFEPFFTTKPVGKGTGLGLALSAGMARDLGGRIEVRNTGSGAEFRILMPAAPQS